MADYQALAANADGNPSFPALALCLRCGAYVGDQAAHDSWHETTRPLSAQEAFEMAGVDYQAALEGRFELRRTGT